MSNWIYFTLSQYAIAILHNYRTFHAKWAYRLHCLTCSGENKRATATAVGLPRSGQRSPWKEVAHNGIQWDILRDVGRVTRSYFNGRSWRQWRQSDNGALVGCVAGQLNCCTRQLSTTYVGLEDTNNAGLLCGWVHKFDIVWWIRYRFPVGCRFGACNSFPGLLHYT